MLLTRSPLRHPPEGGASLDLHVLSTPPAFVLSQNQTLRECLLTATGEPAALSTQKWLPKQPLMSDQSELVLLVSIKEIVRKT